MTRLIACLIVLASVPLRADVVARPSPVEVVAPKPPTPVPAGGKQILAYELHVTNFGAAPLTLRRIEVAGCADFSGPALAAMLTQIGAAKDADPARLEPGRRLVAWMWIALAPGGVPATLRHRLTFDLGEQQSVIDGIVVPVASARPPVLAPPFAAGDWLAGNGPSNTSVHRRSLIPLEGRARIAQRFAVDWVLIGKNGDTWHDSRAKNENFWAFGQPVHAVAGGEVVEAVDAYPDNEPDHPPAVTVENITGNHVIVRVAPGTYVLFAHLRHGSIRVRAHQRVRRGEVIAEVGNSGNTTGAHLHLQVMDAASPLAAEGIPFVFDRYDFLGNAADFDEAHHSSQPRREEMPLDNQVIRTAPAPDTSRTRPAARR